MQLYSDTHSRSDLLLRIKHRLDYVESFPELRQAATRFHQELRTVFPIRDIVTTNWDPYFEEVCAALPIVVPDDYAFWNLPSRKVFKIHGSISNVGSIVATTKDYERCYRRLRSGIIGSSLQHLLATKSVVFVGYSLRDEDFQRIYRSLQRQLADFLPHSFIVTIDDDITAATHPNATIIRTSGAHFVRELKRALVDSEVMIPDEKYKTVLAVRSRLTEARSDIQSVWPPQEFPQVIYSVAYQDGLRHACDRIFVRSSAGEYSDPHHLTHVVQSYFLSRTVAMRQKEYFDAAYVEGYLNGLLIMLLPNSAVRKLPYYFLFGTSDEIRTEKQFGRWIKKAPRIHKASHRAALRMTADIGDLLVHHTPFLAIPEDE